MNIPTLTQISERPMERPQYTPAETYDAWIQLNAERVMDFWRRAGGDIDRSGAYAEMYDFAQTQFATSAIPQPAATAPVCRRAEQEGLSPTAGTGTAGVGDLLVSQYRARIFQYERLIDRLYDMARAERYDELHDELRQEYRAIHGSP